MFNIIKPTGNGVIYYDIIPELIRHKPKTVNNSAECADYILSYCKLYYDFKDDIYVLENLDIPLMSDNIWTWYKQLRDESTVISVYDQVKHNIKNITEQVLSNKK